MIKKYKMISNTHMSSHELKKLGRLLKSKLKHGRDTEGYGEEKLILYINDFSGGDFFEHLKNLYLVAHDFVDRFECIVVNTDKSVHRQDNEKSFYYQYLKTNIMGFFGNSLIVIR